VRQTVFVYGETSSILLRNPIISHVVYGERARARGTHESAYDTLFHCHQTFFPVFENIGCQTWFSLNVLFGITRGNITHALVFESFSKVLARFIDPLLFFSSEKKSIINGPKMFSDLFEKTRGDVVRRNGSSTIRVLVIYYRTWYDVFSKRLNSVTSVVCIQKHRF